MQICPAARIPHTESSVNKARGARPITHCAGTCTDSNTFLCYDFDILSTTVVKVLTGKVAFVPTLSFLAGFSPCQCGALSSTDSFK